MTTALLAGLLAGLIAAPVARRMQPRVRSLIHEPHRIRGRRQPSPDYALLLEAIARQVRSGSSLTSALLEESDRSPPLRVTVEQLRAGASLTEALAVVTPGDADLALTLQALSATAHLGGPVAATLDEAAAVLRERAAARAERLAHGAQARLSARVLTIVPLGFAVWSAVASQRTRDVYVSNVAGAACALCGLALNLVGWRWMKRIVGPS